MSLICLIISIAIFARKSMNNLSTIFLLALNLAEAYNVTTLIIFQVCSLDKRCSENWIYAQFKLYFTTYIGLACRRSVYVYNCLIALQRFLLVAFPIRSRNVRIFVQPVPLCIFVFIFSLALHCYLPVRYNVVNRNGSYVIEDSQITLAHKSLFNALSSTSMYILVYTPLIVGTICNIALFVTLRRRVGVLRRASARKEGPKANKENQINSAILVSTFFFFVFTLPSNVNQLVSFNLEHYGTNRKEHYLFQTLSGAFVVAQVLSDLVIFLSYICTSSSFRSHIFEFVSLASLRSHISHSKNSGSVSTSPVTRISVIMESQVKIRTS
ncbi:hypothetical protein Btru_045709 [Bulinus truncatus]|nr:hypothetical protein Btru_045709 [Bulinus truncatus]